jgi:GDP-L-fucose synthase
MTSRRIFVAGHKGMVGSAIVDKLNSFEDVDLITADRSNLDITDSSKVEKFFKKNNIDEVYMSAAKVGGIHANNTYPAEFIAQNLNIQNNIISSAHNNDVSKLLFLGSSCIYPKNAEQPIVEEALLSGQLEQTNEPYAIAKIAGIKMCESFNRQYGRDYRSVMPTNLYGPNDNFHPQNSHVIPAMMRRFHEALIMNQEEVTVWGSGKPMREFLHVDDMASACIFIMNLSQSKIKSVVPEKMCSHINIGTGEDITIADLASVMAKTVGFKGKLTFDNSKPDGTMRKVLNVNRLNLLGWHSKIDLKNGLDRTYKWFINNQEKLRV